MECDSCLILYNITHNVRARYECENYCPIGPAGEFSQNTIIKLGIGMGTSVNVSIPENVEADLRLIHLVRFSVLPAFSSHKKLVR